jgi:xylan 1,4-beta-xylosidase
MRKIALLQAALFLQAFACMAQTESANPVIKTDLPDPSVIRIGKTYYAAGTSGNAERVYPIYESKDLVTWTPRNTVFDQWPEWTAGAFWAPELYEHNGKVLCYYTALQKADRTSCIGVAVADGIGSPFVDKGPLVKTTNEAIDAYVIEVDGQLYITWKAYGLDPSRRPIEILAQKLSSDGLKLEGEPFSLLRDDERIGMEGQCIFKEGDYYYILYSIRDCCSPQSDYAVSVARSKSFAGPYEKFPGNPILQGNGKDIQSCGHGTMVRTPKNRMYYLCHAYLVGKYKQGRQPIIEELRIGKDGWPYFVGGSKALANVKVNAK